jgi:hypothetical protein
VPDKSLRYLIFYSLGSCTLFIWTRGHISLCVVNVMWIDWDPLTIILHFLNQFWTASRLICSLCEAMAGSLSVATAAVLSAKVAVADFGEVGRSAVYSRYSNGPRTLPFVKLALTGQGSVYSCSAYMRKCLLYK